MKIAIITLTGNFNYGNRLQNYAMKRLLESHGHSADTLDIEYEDDVLASMSRKQAIKSQIKRIVPSKIIEMYKSLKQKGLDEKREYNFRAFEECVPIQKIQTARYKDLQNVEKLKDYDYFVAGSDQIWNPDFAGHQKYFLTFTKPQKRIAFMASVGVKEIPQKWKEYYKKNLTEMKYISVREESSVKLIRDLINREVDCMLDPTLLLEREEWEKIMRKPQTELPSNYIVSFFLGEEPENEVDVYAKAQNLEVIHLENKNYPQYFVINPMEFLYVFANAKLILTDSFHAAVFSVKFRKQFFVFRRKETVLQDMFSRLETLLGRFGLMSRVAENVTDGMEKEEITEEQFCRIEEIIRKERERFDEVAEREVK